MAALPRKKELSEQCRLKDDSVGDSCCPYLHWHYRLAGSEA